MFYVVITVLFFACMLLYFRIARRYNIIDKPNERSSHSAVIIRGGGVVFLLATLVVLVRYTHEFLLPFSGLFCIGIVSFFDDMYTLPRCVRILVQFAAVTMLFIYLHVFSLYAFYVIPLLYILVIGSINAYNFMDGINGITGLYSLVLLLSLQYVNTKQLPFIEPDIIWLPVLACLVFLFFNFRKKAVCFAGDAGSVSIAFWILLVFSLIFKTGNWPYFLFLSVYGVDAVLTIVHRLIRKENIFKPQRLHFYQLLTNEYKIPHTIVSTGYGFLQLLINAWLVESQWTFLPNFLVTCLPLGVLYVLVKPKLLKAITVPA